MRTIIVDDERWMLVYFADECAAISEIELLGKFNNPLTALEFAGKESVEVAFLDIEMPQMNGLELASRLRAINPNIKIVIVSAYEEYKEEVLKSGKADYYLLKPYSSGEVSKIMEQIAKKQRDGIIA